MEELDVSGIEVLRNAEQEEVGEGRMILRETAPGVTVDDIRKVTEAKFELADKVEEMCA